MSKERFQRATMHVLGEASGDDAGEWCITQAEFRAVCEAYAGEMHGRGPDDPSGCPAGNGDQCCGWHDDCRRSLAGTPHD